MRNNRLDFWHWFFVGNGYKPGYRRLVDKYTIIDAIVGIILTSTVSVTLKDAAAIILLVLIGIFVCSSIYCSLVLREFGTKETTLFLEKHRGGVTEHFFILQTVALVMLGCIVLWGLAGLGIYDMVRATDNIAYTIIAFALYASLSLSIRICWEAVSYTVHIMHAKIQMQKITDFRKEKAERNISTKSL